MSRYVVGHGAARADGGGAAPIRVNVGKDAAPEPWTPAAKKLCEAISGLVWANGPAGKGESMATLDALDALSLAAADAIHGLPEAKRRAALQRHAKRAKQAAREMEEAQGGRDG